MTKIEAEAHAENLKRAGWPTVRVSQKPDGSWTAIGEDYSFRPIHFTNR